MSLSTQTVWEVRTTGSSTNGGGYTVGTTGTDFSQQDSPQISVTDAVTTTSTTVTSATAGFTSAHVGNIIYLSGGSGPLTAQRRYVVSVTNSTTIVVDTTLTASTGVTLKLGGAVSSISDIASIIIGSNSVFIKNGSYSQSGTSTFLIPDGSVSPSFPPTRISGYNLMRGDKPTGNNRPLLTLTGGTNPMVMEIYNGYIVENIRIDCGSIAGSIGICCYKCQIVNCSISNFGHSGIKMLDSSVIANCEIYGGISGSTSGIYSNSTQLTAMYCYIHNNACAGISVGVDANIMYCVISNNSTDGIVVTGSNGNVQVYTNNIIYKNSSNGVNRQQDSRSHLFVCKNNIIAENGAWGIILASYDGCPAIWSYDGNAFYKNTSGNRNHMDDTTSNPQQSAGSYVNNFDIILLSDPFINKINNDFRLNNNPTGGLRCQNLGIPQNIQGLSTISYSDYGVFNHKPVIHKIGFNGGFSS